MKNSHVLARFLRGWTVEDDKDGPEELARQERGKLLKKEERVEENVPLVKRLKVEREPFIAPWVIWGTLGGIVISLAYALWSMWRYGIQFPFP